MNKLYAFMGGRSITLAWVSLVATIALAACGKLTPSFAAAITAIPGFYVWRAINDDKAPQ